MTHWRNIIGLCPLLLHDSHCSVDSFFPFAANLWEHLFDELTQRCLRLVWIDYCSDSGNRSKEFDALIFPPGRNGQTLLKCVVFYRDTLD